MQNEKDSKTFIREITILLGSTLTVMAGATIAPSLPQMNMVFQEVPHAELLVKLLLSVHALFIALCAPFSGILLDRWGRKPVLTIAVILYGLAGSSGLVLDSLFAILVGRAFLGVSVAGIMSGFTTLIGDYFEGSKLSKFMGLQAAFTGFGGVIFLTAGGLLADIGWRFPFLIYLFAFSVLPGVLFFIYEPQIDKTSGYKASTDTKPPLPIKNLILLNSLAFLGMLVFYMVPVQLPFYLKSLKNVNNTQIGMAIATMILCAALISMQYGKVRDRFSFQRIFSLLFLLMGTGYLIIAAATSYYQVIAGLIVSGAGFGLLMPNVNVWLVSLVSPEVRGRAVGGLTTCFLMGQFFSPIIMQPIVRQVDIAGSYGVAGVAVLVFSVVFGLMGFKQKV
jgi:MFS family permease